MCKYRQRAVHLNGHIIRFGPQTQKIKSPYKTTSNTLAVKGLMEVTTIGTVTGMAKGWRPPLETLITGRLREACRLMEAQQ